VSLIFSRSVCDIEYSFCQSDTLAFVRSCPSTVAAGRPNLCLFKSVSDLRTLKFS
jgi:hypothetical protein